MIKLFREISKCICNQIESTIQTDQSLFVLCLNAYNYWVEQERDGNGYIFNVNDKSDLKYIVDKDVLSLKEIINIASNTGYFLISDDREICQLKQNEILTLISANLEYVIRCAILYVGRCGGDEKNPYVQLYEKYVTEVLEANNYASYTF